MEQKGKLVSVFVPYYNDRAFLGDCIDSILGQTYANFELILLNHASTDGSDQVAMSYSDKRIRHIALPENLGAGGGLLLREFLKTAQGEYIKLFCADDIMRSDCLEIFIRFMERNPKTDVVFGNVEYVDEHRNPLGDNWFDNRAEFDSEDRKFDMLRKYRNGISFLPYIGCFAKKDVFSTLDLNRTFIMMFDMGIWIELLFNDSEFNFLDEIVASYRIHRGQVSSIHNSGTAAARSFYESIAYCDIFYTRIRDVETLRNLFGESPFLDRTGEQDTDLIEFVIAQAYLSDPNISYRVNAYLRLERIFSDDRLRARIQEKFAYGIKEFREDYSDVSNPSRRNFYIRQLKDLPVTQITRILFSKSWKVISDKTLRKWLRSARRKKKQYTA